MGTTIEIIKEYVEFSKLFGKNTENLKEIEEELKKIEKKLSEKNRKIWYHIKDLDFGQRLEMEKMIEIEKMKIFLTIIFSLKNSIFCDYFINKKGYYI